MTRILRNTFRRLIADTCLWVLGRVLRPRQYRRLLMRAITRAGRLGRRVATEGV